MKNSPLLILLLVTFLVGSGCSRKTNTTQSQAPGNEQLKPESAAQPRFTVFRVDARTSRVELFLKDDAGGTFNHFERLKSWLARRNEQLVFAMNAGMYKSDFSPVGLFVQNGHVISSLNLADGDGNFFLKPNGVFLISESGPRIVESTEYPALAQGVRLATQSGPLLVRKGILHPAISATSDSRLIRNGVGLAGDTINFVISDQPVSFYEMATYFRDVLHCADALYLDGVVSGIYSTELKRNDSTVGLGPIIGVLE
jgi:uncharacterized protein YigE (DUF2233 family)